MRLGRFPIQAAWIFFSILYFFSFKSSAEPYGMESKNQEWTNNREIEKERSVVLSGWGFRPPPSSLMKPLSGGNEAHASNPLLGARVSLPRTWFVIQSETLRGRDPPSQDGDEPYVHLLCIWEGWGERERKVERQRQREGWRERDRERDSWKGSVSGKPSGIISIIYSNFMYTLLVLNINSYWYIKRKAFCILIDLMHMIFHMSMWLLLFI